MKNLFMSLFLVFIKFTIEKIHFTKTYPNCGSIRGILQNLINYCIINKNYENCNDGLNPENCNLRESLYGNKCCYVSLRLNGTQYSFCGANDRKVKTDKEIQKFMEEIQEKLDYIPKDIDIKNILKIDCVGEKINYNKIFSLIILTLFIL